MEFKQIIPLPNGRIMFVDTEGFIWMGAVDRDNQQIYLRRYHVVKEN